MATAPTAVSVAPQLVVRTQRWSLVRLLAVAAVLLKVRIVGLVVFTGLVAAVVAGQRPIAIRDLLLFALAGTLGAGGAAMLNHYVDRDIDGRMGRTHRRPLPAGELQPASVLIVGLALLALALPIALLVHPTLPVFIAAGAIVYVLIYTWWLKRRTPHSVVLGGWTGSSAVLGGWAMTGEPLTLGAWALAAVIFFWTPAHFWGLALVRQEDYRAARIPTLPAVAGVVTTTRAILLGTLLTLLASLAPWLTGDLGLVYAVVALGGGGLFALQTLRLARRFSTALAWQTYKLSGLYLLVLFLAMLADVAMG